VAVGRRAGLHRPPDRIGGKPGAQRGRGSTAPHPAPGSEGQPAEATVLVAGFGWVRPKWGGGCRRCRCRVRGVHSPGRGLRLRPGLLQDRHRESSFSGAGVVTYEGLTAFNNYLFKLGDADEYITNRPGLRVTYYPGVGRHCSIADAIARAVRKVLLCNFDSFKTVGNNVSIATNHKPPCVDSVCGS